MTFRDVSITVWANGPELGFSEAGGDVNQSVPENGARNVREAGNVDPPDFFASERFVGTDAVGAHADELVFAIDLDDERGVIGFLEFTGLRNDLTAVGFPDEF